MQTESDFPTSQEIAKYVVDLVEEYQAKFSASPMNSADRMNVYKIEVGAQVAMGTITNFRRIANGTSDRSFYYSTAERVVSFLNERLAELGDQAVPRTDGAKAARLETLLGRLRAEQDDPDIG